MVFDNSEIKFILFVITVTFFCHSTVQVNAMIDPRNLPHARVFLARMSPSELPLNALKQYHNYAAKRKSSGPVISETKETDDVGVSGDHPPAHFSLELTKGANKHTVNSKDTSKESTFSCTTSSKLRMGNLLVPLIPLSSASYNPHHPENNSFVTQVHVNHASDEENGLSADKDISVSADSNGSQSANYSWHRIGEVDTTPGYVRSSRTNSVSSTTSSHSRSISKGKEQIPSVRLTPIVLFNPLGRLLKPLNSCKSKTDEGLNKTTTSKSTVLGKSRRNSSYYLRNKVKAIDFSYEEVSITSSSAASDVSEPSAPSDEISSVGFSSSKDLDIYGCEDLWPDIASYSPPESPEQNRECMDHVFPMGTDKCQMKAKEHVHVSLPLKSDLVARSMQSEVKSLPENHSDLLSPEIKLLPLKERDHKQCVERLSVSSVSPPNGKSLSHKVEPVIKLNDVGKKLKPSRNGGLAFVTGRCTSSGRKVLSNYSEKSLAKSVLKQITATKAKKRRKRKKFAKGSASASVADNKHGGKSDIKLRNPAGRMKANVMSRYENLQFKELNTISRMSMRYKVAFTKWPFVFSGALDLINQRLANQNAFWDAIRC